MTDGRHRRRNDRRDGRGNDRGQGGLGRLVKRCLSFLCAFSLLGVGALIVFLLYLRTQALPTATILQTSQILDIHGDVIDSYHLGQNRQVVPLKKISKYLIDATLAIEDHRFYEHHGFDVRGMGRAAAVNARHMDKVQGASTLTQQLARNLYLTQERTWTRKLKEAILTVQLEMRETKDQILEQYLNQIYYGHSTYGIEAAAELFYGKHALDLDLAESSLIAGVPKGPKYYSPYLNYNNAKSRQQTILTAMVKYGYITQKEAGDAYAEPLQIKPLVSSSASVAPYFRDYIRYVALEQLGISENLYNKGGIKIYTTLDLRAQKIAEAVVAENIAKGSELQASLVALDPRTGYIKALVGGTDYTANQFNRALAKTRQPGSSFKPVLYLTALQEPGFTPATLFKSEPTVFTYDDGRKTYTPNNFGSHYSHEEITLRKALAQSDNIYAVHTIMQTGPEKVIDMAHRLGIDSQMKPLPSLALGTFPVSPLQMASAFGTIANAGVRVEPTAILRVEDAKGAVLYDARPKQERVVDPAAAYVLTNLMESVFEPGGTGYRVASQLKRPVAGKTGTTDTDAWMVGFTPELATAVWVGYDRGRDIGTIDSRKAAPIFAEFTERTLESVPPKLFAEPDGVVSVYIDPANGKLATEQCPDKQLEVFIKGTEPTETSGLHGGAAESSKDSKHPDDSSGWWDDLKRWWND